METYLPNNCFRDSPLDPEWIVIHFFSCINVQPKNPYHLHDCWLLMNDLNLPKSLRVKFLKGEDDAEKRSWASAHAMIGRDGTRAITVPYNRQAYHAGVSSYKGLKNWNGFSYGVELIGSLTSGFTDAQYDDLASLCAGLMKEFPKITMNRIVGHEQISPGRKVDPGIATGNFDMPRLKLKIPLALEL